MDHHIYTLPNGIRLLFKPSQSNISHTCVVINSGSRDESESECGLAHFIEHMLFKQTEKRNTCQILNRLEIVGGDLNAYTTKEYTCIHASYLNPYLERCLDLFEDLLFHSVFPENEMEKEKSVILDEIASYEDQPEDAVNDDFDQLLFPDHPLGKNILGTVDSVKSLDKSAVLTFIQRNYNPQDIVIGVYGKYDFKKIQHLTLKLFENIACINPKLKRIEPPVYQPIQVKSIKQISQVHGVIGTRAYDMHHPNKTGLLLLNNILGGNGMSSRLNMQIREKHGIAYTIDSSYSPLSDTGVLSIYFGTDLEKADKALTLINKELVKLCEKQLSEIQLKQAKTKFIGQIALGEENRMGLLISMSKSLLDYNRVDTLEEVFNKINAVSAPQLIEIANEILIKSRLSCLLFEPEVGLE